MLKHHRKDKIKVLISGQDSGGIGGSEVFLKHFSDSLGRYDIEVSFTVVYNSDYYNFLKKTNTKIYPTPIRMDVIGGWKGLLKFIFFYPFALIWNYRILKSFKKRAGNIVFLSGFSDKIIISPLAKLLGFSLVWIEYAPLTRVFESNFYIPKILYRLVKDLPDTVIIPSENTLKHIIPETRISLAKINVIPLGIKIFTNKMVDRLKRNKFKVKSDLGIKDKYVIGMVSRLEVGKGQGVLIKAASILKKKRDDFVVLIVGGGESDYLEKLASNLSVKNFVKFLGYIKDDDKFKLISAFDIATFPTRWKLEGFGLVSLEAMMMKIPLIASDFGPVPEVVGDSAELCEPKPRALASKIEKILDDKVYANKLALKGRMRVENFFDINKFTDLIIKEFEDLLLLNV